MKALLLDSPGSPETLRVGEIEIPLPQRGEVLVKVVAAALNPADYKFAAKGIDSWQYPFILGLDVAGTVEAVGENVSQWRLGDKPTAWLRYAFSIMVLYCEMVLMQNILLHLLTL